MKARFVLGLLAALALVIGLPAGLARSQRGVDLEVPQSNDEVTVAISPLLTYQGRLVENGVPVSGSRQMTFRLYDASSSGTLVWQEGPKTINVSNGLFATNLGDSTALPVDAMDQALWLEVLVGATTLPRQQLSGAAYALSLAPGADVSGAPGGATFYAENTAAQVGIHGKSAGSTGVYGESSSGHGIAAYSSGVGKNGSAMWAQSGSAGGIAIWGMNQSSDAALVVENNGSGALIKGFGGDDGEDEFQVLNNGTLQSKADSYLFVPGIEAVAGSPNDELWPQSDGSVQVYTDDSGASIYIPVPIQGVLYGQAVEIEELTVYYQSPSEDFYIWETALFRQRLLDHTNPYILVDETGNPHNSTAYTSYTLPVTSNNVLSVEDGLLTVYLYIHFDTPGIFTIGGVRLKLGHHPLY